MAIALPLILSLAALESVARVSLPLSDALIHTRLASTESPDLQEYQMLDPASPGVWRLRPAFSETLGEAIRSKTQAGHVVGAQYLKERAPVLGVSDDEIIYQVNAAGLKGPELDPAHARPRILTLGDSCTFGSLFDRYTYPRTLERELRGLGQDVEVVNGGVEGYSPREILARIDEFKVLRPEVTTLYIGWNALYSEPLRLPQGLAKYSTFAYLIGAAVDRLEERRAGQKLAALAALNKPKHPNPTAEELAALETYEPSFVGWVERIVDEMQSVGSRVVLITLPGLFDADEVASDRAVQLGHLPPYTDNPYVLAKLSRRYNLALRQLATRRGLAVIDLEQWSKTALQPRDVYFLDSVHAYEDGQTRIGTYMAEVMTDQSVIQASSPSR